MTRMTPPSREATDKATHDGEMLSVPAAAAVAGVSERTMRRILARGALPYTVPSHHPRIRRRDLDAYLAGRSSDRRVVLTVPPGGDPFADVR